MNYLRPLKARLIRKWQSRGLHPGNKYPRPQKAEAGRLFADAESFEKAGDFEAAGRSFLRVLRHVPISVDVAKRVLTCALRSSTDPQPVEEKKAAAESAAQLAREVLFSIVVCSNEQTRFNGFRERVERAMQGSSWELIRISDARSMNEGFQRGVEQSRGEILVFCHDDIGFIADDVPARIAAGLNSHDIVGVAGTDRLVGPAWWAAGSPYIHSWVCRPTSRKGYLLSMLGAYGPTISHVHALDGMFLAARRNVVEDLGFDQRTFDGFHFYDIDFAWRARLRGFNVGILLDLTLWHSSGGNFGAEWSRYAGRFVEKFPGLADRIHAPQLTVPYIELRDAAAVRSVVTAISRWVS